MAERGRQPIPRSGHQGDGGGISALTLAIASVASVASAYTVSRLWGPGTLIGAAATPIIVALVSEALRRPAERVPPIVTARAQRHGSAAEPAPPPQPAPGTAGAGDLAPRKDFSLRRRRRWGLAVITGLAAFVIVACVVTIADVVTGEPVTGRDGDSSLFDFRNRTDGHRTRTAPTTDATTPSISTPTTSTPTTTTTTTTPAPATSAPPPTTTSTLPGAPAAPASTTTTP